jgi:hydroxyacyl-ACP dehydratase HTD2-like protein with hotdog domain
LSSSSTDPQLDLVGDAARELVGREIVRRVGVVRKESFQRWAAAVKDHNPLYFDADYARAQGHPDVVMPPLFLQDISHAILPLSELTADGLPQEGEVYAIVTFPACPRRMAAGVDTTFYSSVYDGDEITTVSVVQSVVQKHGRSGDFVVVSWLTKYTRQDGAVVAEETRSLIARPQEET